jgi:Ger(x)C family germination protein
MKALGEWIRGKGASVLYALFILLFTIVFFTNDFGLTDIRKTSVVVGMGIDAEGDNINVTAQIAVPQPSESGENTKFTQINGSGSTVGEAINEINAKVGFYPKLIFCKLIILGESCKDRDIFALLDYFYRNEHTQLTPVVAMCEGTAAQLLESNLPFGDTATISVERLLSDESKKTGNVATVNLKCLGLLHNSVSNACYMPYISGAQSTESEQASNGEQGGQSNEQSNGQSNEQSGGQGGQSTQSSGQGGEQTELTCSRTAIFKDGMFCGVLDEKQAFALNLVRNEIRHAFVVCDDGESKCTLGLRSCDGRISLRFDGDKPVLKITFKGVAQLQDENLSRSPKNKASRVVSAEVLQSGESALKEYFNQLLQTLVLSDCDVIGVTKLLHRFNYSHFEECKENLLANMQTELNIKLVSSA